MATGWDAGQQTAQGDVGERQRAWKHIRKLNAEAPNVLSGSLDPPHRAAAILRRKLSHAGRGRLGGPQFEEQRFQLMGVHA